MSDPLEGIGRTSVRNPDAAAFVAAVQAAPGFWTFDFPLKYLGIHMDTREGGFFRLSDRDGNAIEPQRVLDAIAKWREFRGEAAPSSQTEALPPVHDEQENGQGDKP